MYTSTREQPFVYQGLRPNNLSNWHKWPLLPIFLLPFLICMSRNLKCKFPSLSGEHWSSTFLRSTQCKWSDNWKQVSVRITLKLLSSYHSSDHIHLLQDRRIFETIRAATKHCLTRYPILLTDISPQVTLGSFVAFVYLILVNITNVQPCTSVQVY